MDVIKVKDCIENLIHEIGKIRREIEQLWRDMALASSGILKTHTDIKEFNAGIDITAVLKNVA